jgi:hypothetical protein
MWGFQCPRRLRPLAARRSAAMAAAMAMIAGAGSLHGVLDSSKVTWMARHLVDINR